MNLRERLADMISGGALTRARGEFDRMFELHGKAVDRMLDHHDKTMEIGKKAMEAKIALRSIAAMETPNCAHIGRRMAKVAREALE